MRTICQPLVLAYGAYLVVNGVLDAGLMIIAIIISSQALKPLTKVVDTNQSMKSLKISIGKISSIEEYFDCYSGDKSKFNLSNSEFTNADIIRTYHSTAKLLNKKITENRLHILEDLPKDDVKLFIKILFSTLKKSYCGKENGPSHIEKTIYYVNEKQEIKFNDTYKYAKFNNANDILHDERIKKEFLNSGLIKSLNDEILTKNVKELTPEKLMLLKLLTCYYSNADIFVIDFSIKEKSNSFLSFLGVFLNRILSEGKTVLLITDESNVKISGAVHIKTKEFLEQ